MHINKEIQNEAILQIKQYFYPGFMMILLYPSNNLLFGLFWFIAEMQSILYKTNEHTLQIIRLTWWRDAIRQNTPNIPLLEYCNHHNYSENVINIFENISLNKDIDKQDIDKILHAVNLYDDILSDIMYAYFSANQKLKNSKLKNINNKTAKKFAIILEDIIKHPNKIRFRPGFIIKLLFN